jgi:hypothetical protein
MKLHEIVGEIVEGAAACLRSAISTHQVQEPAIGNSCEGCEILRALTSLHTHKAREARRALVITR